jgi:cytochrome c biogenesis factor
LLGSWWAYHELGWGGWWFWDPVENASLMPWILATTCIHPFSIMFPNHSIFAYGENYNIVTSFVYTIPWEHPIPSHFKVCHLCFKGHIKS